MSRPSLLPDEGPIRQVDRSNEREQPPTDVMATEDPDVIREWASRHGAEPATGEATPSGPATVDVQDGGAGIRFNFPGAAPFRPIEWDEWLENFRRHGLVFVYEAAAPGQPPSARYRLVPRQKLRTDQTLR